MGQLESVAAAARAAGGSELGWARRVGSRLLAAAGKQCQPLTITAAELEQLVASMNQLCRRLAIHCANANAIGVATLQGLENCLQEARSEVTSRAAVSAHGGGDGTHDALPFHINFSLEPSCFPVRSSQHRTQQPQQPQEQQDLGSQGQQQEQARQEGQEQEPQRTWPTSSLMWRVSPCVACTVEVTASFELTLRNSSASATDDNEEEEDDDDEDAVQVWSMMSDVGCRVLTVRQLCAVHEVIARGVSVLDVASMNSEEAEADCATVAKTLLHRDEGDSHAGGDSIPRCCSEPESVQSDDLEAAGSSTGRNDSEKAREKPQTLATSGVSLLSTNTVLYASIASNVQSSADPESNPNATSALPSDVDTTRPPPSHPEQTYSISPSTSARSFVSASCSTSTVSEYASASTEAEEECAGLCTICLERSADVALPCAHAYCSLCIGRWSTVHRCCPVCRRLTADDQWLLAESPQLRHICRHILLQLAARLVLAKRRVDLTPP